MRRTRLLTSPSSPRFEPTNFPGFQDVLLGGSVEPQESRPRGAEFKGARSAGAAGPDAGGEAAPPGAAAADRRRDQDPEMLQREDGC